MSRVLGYRYITDELRDRGYDVGSGRVYKICRRAGISSTMKRKKRGVSKSKPASAENLIKRQFNADAPNTAWLTDITEHPTKTGKLYVCAIKDLYSNYIVGLAIGDRMTASLTTSTLHDAAACRGAVHLKGCIIHSDRGGQFHSQAFKSLVTHYKMRQSMGQVATCADNAAMESFFSLLQRNVLNHQT